MIYIFIAPGFEEMEALAPLDILRRAEVDVQTVGVGGKTITGSHGISVVCDITQEEAVLDGLSMIVLPGGMPGTLNLEKSLVVQQMIDHAATSDLWIAAICAAPSILGHKGLLDNRKATCFPGFETQLGSAQFTGAFLEQDGRFLTARGAGVSIEFGLLLAECIVGKERAALLKASLQCQN